MTAWQRRRQRTTPQHPRIPLYTAGCSPVDGGSTEPKVRGSNPLGRVPSCPGIPPYDRVSAKAPSDAGSAGNRMFSGERAAQTSAHTLFVPGWSGP
jgi:hypothetical protein